MAPCVRAHIVVWPNLISGSFDLAPKRDGVCKLVALKPYMPPDTRLIDHVCTTL